MKREERDALLRQGVHAAETPNQRRELAGLEADLEGSPLTGRRLPGRLRNFRPSADAYLASLAGPLPYMVRLREIARLTEQLEAALAESWHVLAVECAGNEAAFASRWAETAKRWSLNEVNDLIDRHNRWYPVESRLPMDPVTRDYALVNGEDYRRRPLGPDWILERFPAALTRVA
jgi:hypothetical protein